MEHSTMIGKIGEKIARKYLIDKGYYIFAQNARFSHKEVDLIVIKEKEIRIIEVKTMFNSNQANTRPEDYISNNKIRLLKQVYYEISLILDKNKQNIYIDLIAITLKQNKMANISHFKNII